MADSHISSVTPCTPPRRRETASSLLAAFSPTRSAASPATLSVSPTRLDTPTNSRTCTSPPRPTAWRLQEASDGAPSGSADLTSSLVGHSTPVQTSTEDYEQLDLDRSHTPSCQAVSYSSPNSPQTPLSQPILGQTSSPFRLDSRTGSERSLRARQSLSLSTKAKANIDRGFKDPRQYQDLLPNAGKPPTCPSSRAIREEHSRKILSDYHDNFVWAYKGKFLPLLPHGVNHVQSIANFRAVSQGSSSGHSMIRDHVKYARMTEQPKGINATLKRHQLQGLSFLVWLQANGCNGILGDDMGLGKTLQTLALLQHIKNHVRDLTVYKPSIVVCPLSILQNWQSQARSFTPALTTMIVHAPIANRHIMRSSLRKAVNDKSVDLVIISYETYERELLALRRYKWSYAILDEGHKMKNADSRIAKALQSVAAEHRLILTGTPIQNDLFELWSLFHWLLPKVFGANTRSLFEDSFVLSKRGGVNVATIAHARNLLELVMLRRTKQDVQAEVKLPTLTHIILSIPLTPLQRKTYTACVTSTGDDLLKSIAQDEQVPDSDQKFDSKPLSAEGGTHRFKELLNLLIQLRKVSIHPYLLPGVQPEPYELGAHVYESSGKFLVLKALLLKLVVEEGQKVIIFSGFKGALDCADDLLKTIVGDTVKLLRIDGDGSRVHRNLSVRLFQEDPTYPVMLATLRAGGFGLTLTAAQAVVFLDQDWNPQVTIQAAARAHRIGQTKPVTVYKLISSGTIEVQMERRIAKKLYLSAKVTDSFKHTNSGTFADEDTLSQATEETSTMPKFSLSQLASMIRSGTDTVSNQSISAKDMLEWSFEQIMSHCAETRTSAEIDEEAEQKWLQEREHTQVTEFEGVIHQRAKRGKDFEDEGVEFASPRKARRFGKETTVQIDGFAVSKFSIGCVNGEAVPTLTSKDASLLDSPRAERQRFGHIKTCTICGETTVEELLDCYDCPKAYHPSCAVASKILPMGYQNMRRCPAHKCCKCMRTSSDSGGFLFKCTDCPRAFCEDDVDLDLCQSVGFELKNFADLGFVNKQKEFYIKCKRCCGTLDPAAMEGEALSGPKTCENVGGAEHSLELGKTLGYLAVSSSSNGKSTTLSDLADLSGSNGKSMTQSVPQKCSKGWTECESIWVDSD